MSFHASSLLALLSQTAPTGPRGNPVICQGIIPDAWRTANLPPLPSASREPAPSPQHDRVVESLPESLAESLPESLPERLPDDSMVVVSGGGILAFAIAYYLSVAQVPVLVLSPWADDGDPSAFGPGLLMPGIGEEPLRLVQGLGEASARALYHFSCAGVARALRLCEALGVPMTRTSALMGVRQERVADLLGSEALLGTWGLTAHERSAEVLTSREWRNRNPHLSHALEWPEAGLISPLDLLKALRSQAIGMGTVVSPQTHLTAVTETSNGIELETTAGPVRCELLVHAGGAAFDSVNAFVSGLVHPARTPLMWATPKDAGGHPLCLPGTGASGYDHWRPLQNGVLVGGLRYLRLEQGLDWWRDEPDPRQDLGLNALASALLGPDSQWEVRGRWSRLIDIPCDGLPVMGSLPGLSRQLMAVGFAGLDSTLGIEAAYWLSQAILTGQSEGIPELLSPRRML